MCFVVMAVRPHRKSPAVRGLEYANMFAKLGARVVVVEFAAARLRPQTRSLGLGLI